MNIHSSIVNSQKMATTQMSSLMNDEANYGISTNGILFDNEKE
jgi:hypothetical protein